MSTMLYTSALQRHMDGTLTGAPIDWANDTNIYAALVSDAVNYVDGTPDPDDGVFVADILNGTTASEYNTSDASYERQQIAAADRTTGIDATNNEVEARYTGSGVTWPALSADAEGDNIAGVLLFKQGVTDDTDAPVIALIDPPEAPLAGNGGDVTLNFTTEATGDVVYKITASVV